MRRAPAAVLALALAAGCGKKPAPDAPPAEPPAETAAPAPPERDVFLAVVKDKRGDAQLKAADKLAALAETDPAVIDGLIDLLREKKNTGAKQTHPQRVGSVREAASGALARSGPAGEKALVERGLPILREGLSDPDPAVREHAAYTLGRLGPLAKPAAPYLQRLCTDADPKVAEVAFDAVAAVGVGDVAAFAPLLTHKDEATRRRAAEIVALLPEVPADAVPALTRALADPDLFVRAAAGSGVAAAGGKGATAATGEALGAAIQASYPAKLEDEPARQVAGPEFVFWPALRGCGKHAVKPATDLLAHGHPGVRQMAARVLGGLGADAKPAADVLRKSLADAYANVALEAGCSLVRLGEKTDEVDALVRAALASLSPGVAAEAVAAVARMGPAGAAHHPAVLERLESPFPDARYAALGFVETLPPAERAKHLPAVGKLLTDDEPLIRGRAAGVVEALGPAAATAAPALAAALNKEDEPGVQEQLVNAVAALGPGGKAAVGALLPPIADRAVSTPVRVKLVLTAAALDPASPDVAAAVTRATTASDLDVRCAAARALGSLNPLPPDAAALLAKVAKTDGEVPARLAALRGLAAAGVRAKGARADVEHVAAKGQPGADVWARVALAAIDGDVRTAAPLVRTSLSNRNPNARAAAAEALVLVGPTAADVPALVRVLADAVPAGRAGAAACLAQLGAAAAPAVPRLIPLAVDADAAVRVAAADALGAVGAPAAAPAIPRLREALREYPHDAPTVVAVNRALTRLGAAPDAPPAR